MPGWIEVLHDVLTIPSGGDYEGDISWVTFNPQATPAPLPANTDLGQIFHDGDSHGSMPGTF